MPNYTENLNLFKYDTTTDGNLPFNLQNALNSNWDILDEAVNDKLDITEMQEVQCVIETYVNGTSWYRIWSDGWCEQGGYGSLPDVWTITFLKPFASSTYYLQGEMWGIDSSGNLGIINQTPTSANGNISGSSGGTVTWQASGYIA